MKTEIEITHSRTRGLLDKLVVTSHNETEITHLDLPEGINQPFLPGFTPEDVPTKNIVVTKKIVHETPRFRFLYEEWETGNITFDFIVLGIGDFDLVEPMGMGVEFAKEDKTKNNRLQVLNHYLKLLNRSKSEGEKEKILRDLYFIFTGSFSE